MLRTLLSPCYASWHIGQGQVSSTLLCCCPCYASWHIGQGQVSSTLLCCWLFFLLCPRCVLFPLFHYRWCASVLFLVFLFFCSLLVSILGLPLSCLQMAYVEHDEAISISFESTKSPCPWCFWCHAGLRFLSVILQHSEPYRSTDSTQLL